MEVDEHDRPSRRRALLLGVFSAIAAVGLVLRARAPIFSAPATVADLAADLAAVPGDSRYATGFRSDRSTDDAGDTQWMPPTAEPTPRPSGIHVNLAPTPRPNTSGARQAQRIR